MNRRLLVAACCFGLAVAAAALPAAVADGPPPGVVSDGAGITSPDGKLRYFALASGSQTLLEAVNVRGGTLFNETWLLGQFAIPAIAWTPTGMTPDGKTLVVETYPWLRGGATFVVVRTPELDRRRVVRLRGSWAYDAISPDGRTLYLIQSLASRDSAHYLVRAYDLRLGRLLTGAIADRRERGPMTGAPVTRATTRTGTWAYTLYTKANGTAFVHALDTVHRRAVCIDLPWPDASAWIWEARLHVSRDGTKLFLSTSGGGPRAVIDTRTWVVEV